MILARRFVLVGLFIAQAAAQSVASAADVPDRAMNEPDEAEREATEMSDEQQIRAVLDRFVESWNAHDAEQAALVYTDPHFDVNATPQEERRQTTVEKFRHFYNEFDTSISVTSDDIIIFGDHAVQRGEFVLTSTPRQGGDTEVITRRYVEVLWKDASGHWAVHWGIDGPLAAQPDSDSSH